jgi:hypothetical protein
MESLDAIHGDCVIGTAEDRERAIQRSPRVLKPLFM